MADVGFTSGGDLIYPSDFVRAGWEYFQEMADRAVNSAYGAISRMEGFQLELPEIAFDVNFDDIELSTNVVLPNPPALPNIVFASPTLPDPPTLDPITPIVLDAAPAAPDLSGIDAIQPPGNGPGEFTDLAPTRPTVDFDEVFPTAPSTSLPPVPVLRTINIPTMQALNIPALTITDPEFTAQLPNTAISFTEQEYSSGLLDSTRDKILEIMAGGLGLPPDIEQQLFDRGAGREDRLARRAVQEAAEEFSANGFDLPNGLLSGKLDAVRQENQNKGATFSREVMLQNKTLFIDNLKYMVAQGIALEQLTMNLHDKVQQRALEFAKVAADMELAFFNAQVAKFGAEVQLVEARVRVFEGRLKAELAKLEVFRGQIEAQRLVGEINQQDVQLYTALLQGVESQIKLYTGQIEAVKVKIQAKVAVLDGYKSDVDAFRGLVGAYQARWDGYTAQTQAYTARISSFEIPARIYSEQVKGWGIGASAKIEQSRANAQNQQVIVQQYGARLDTVKTYLQAESERVKALALTGSMQSDLYKAQVQAGVLDAEGQARITNLAIERERGRTAVALQNATLKITQAQERGRLLLGALQGSSEAYAQLAASLASGVNLGASYTGSLSDSFSKQISFNYSGETNGSASP